MDTVSTGYYFHARWRISTPDAPDTDDAGFDSILLNKHVGRIISNMQLERMA